MENFYSYEHLWKFLSGDQHHHNADQPGRLDHFTVPSAPPFSLNFEPRPARYQEDGESKFIMWAFIPEIANALRICSAQHQMMLRQGRGARNHDTASFYRSVLALLEAIDLRRRDKHHSREAQACYDKFFIQYGLGLLLYDPYDSMQVAGWVAFAMLRIGVTEACCEFIQWRLTCTYAWERSPRRIENIVPGSPGRAGALKVDLSLALMCLYSQILDRKREKEGFMAFLSSIRRAPVGSPTQELYQTEDVLQLVSSYYHSSARPGSSESNHAAVVRHLFGPRAKLSQLQIPYIEGHLKTVAKSAHETNPFIMVQLLKEAGHACCPSCCTTDSLFADGGGFVLRQPGSMREAQLVCWRMDLESAFSRNHSWSSLTDWLRESMGNGHCTREIYQ